MKILLTGASSFSGFWFAKTLVAAGHDVVAPIRGKLADYEGIRANRVNMLGQIAEIVPEAVFGGEGFLELVRGRDFDALGHHAARVVDYRSLQFDVAAALAENTNNLGTVLEAMAARGLKAVIATGSVFENDEGRGDVPLEAFSPYGLSKSMTYQSIRFWSHRYGVPLGKFVISNPFGPYEEPRFCNYLMRCWSKCDTATVSTPRYVRDNIHIDLLSLVYAQFVEDVVSGGEARIGPSGYVESQGDFALRFAAHMRRHMALPCEIALFDQIDFLEPRTRVNTTELLTNSFGWSETAAWRQLAEYYRELFGI